MASLFGQLAFDGITIGMVYVILAAGLVFILSITEILFIAYGMFYMIGAYAVWYAVYDMHAPYFAALVVGVIATSLLGVLSYFLIFQRLQTVLRAERPMKNIRCAISISSSAIWSAPLNSLL